jgi:hypothetical protein
MSFLLYVHVESDHFVIACKGEDTIQDVIRLAEEAYASLFHHKPPLSIGALKNSLECFLPNHLQVAKILGTLDPIPADLNSMFIILVEPHAHLVAVIHTFPKNVSFAPSGDLHRSIAMWDHWQVVSATL